MCLISEFWILPILSSTQTRVTKLGSGSTGFSLNSRVKLVSGFADGLDDASDLSSIDRPHGSARPSPSCNRRPTTERTTITFQADMLTAVANFCGERIRSRLPEIHPVGNFRRMRCGSSQMESSAHVKNLRPAQDCLCFLTRGGSNFCDGSSKRPSNSLAYHHF